MRVVIADEKRKRRQSKSGGKKKKNWFPAWKQKKVLEGTWNDKTANGGKKK